VKKNYFFEEQRIALRLQHAASVSVASECNEDREHLQTKKLHNASAYNNNDYDKDLS